MAELPNEVEVVEGDIRDADALRRAIKECHAVFHLASLYSFAQPDAALMEAINVAGTRTLLEAAVTGPRRRIVHTSTCATCGPVPGRPATERDLPPPADLVVPYKRTKLEAERLAFQAAREGADVVVVNPTVPVGPGDRRPTPTGKMVADVARGRAPAYLAGSALNVVAVEDVATGHVQAFERGRRGQRYLLGGENMSIRDVFGVIARAVGRRPLLLPVPWPLVYAAARLSEAAMRSIGREPRLLLVDEVRAGRLPHLFDDAKARAELGYVSRPATYALTAAAHSALIGQRSARAPGTRLAPSAP